MVNKLVSFHVLDLTMSLPNFWCKTRSGYEMRDERLHAFQERSFFNKVSNVRQGDQQVSNMLNCEEQYISWKIEA